MRREHVFMMLAHCSYDELSTLPQRSAYVSASYPARLLHIHSAWLHTVSKKGPAPVRSDCHAVSTICDKTNASLTADV